jgi:glutathione S-transferase
MIYHVTMNAFFATGLRPDFVQAGTRSKGRDWLAVAERELAQTKISRRKPIADFFLLPSTFAFSLTEEGKAMYPKYPAFCRWRERMENLPTTRKLRAILPPREPILHAREWASSHRPRH